MLTNIYSPHTTKGLQNTRSAKQKKEKATYTTGTSNVIISRPGGVYPHLHDYLLTPFNREDHCKSRRHTEHTIETRRVS